MTTLKMGKSELQEEVTTKFSAGRYPYMHTFLLATVGSLALYEEQGKGVLWKMSY